MQQQDVDKLLTDYRENVARYNHLHLEAMDMVIRINAEARRAIAGDAIQAQQYRDTPPSGRVSKPVEDLALRYMDGYMPDTLRDWMAESESMQRELNELQKNIAFVDTWLSALTATEKAIVQASRIDGLRWSDISLKSQQMLGEYRCERTLRNMCKVAMTKIYNIAR